MIFVISIAAIDVNDSNSYGNYRVEFTSLLYNMQGDKSYDGILFESVEIVPNGIYLSPSIGHSIWHVSAKEITKINTI